MEMQGRFEEGGAWLRQHQGAWAEGNGFACHLWWHKAMFHVERGEFDGEPAMEGRPAHHLVERAPPRLGGMGGEHRHVQQLVEQFLLEPLGERLREERVQRVEVERNGHLLALDDAQPQAALGDLADTTPLAGYDLEHRLDHAPRLGVAVLGHLKGIKSPPQHAIAIDRACWQGEAVAVVVER